MVELKTFSELLDAEQPKRLVKYVLICCTKGSAVMVIDDKELKLNKNQIVTITSGQIHYFKKE